MAVLFYCFINISLLYTLISFLKINFKIKIFVTIKTAEIFFVCLNELGAINLIHTCVAVTVTVFVPWGFN